LQEVLDREGLRWYVFGAQAVVVYGRPRLTADVDVTIEASLEGTLALIPDLSRRGFETRAPEPGELLRRTRVLPLVHLPSGLAVDVVVAGPGLARSQRSHGRSGSPRRRRRKVPALGKVARKVAGTQSSTR
jgi:hypothetical protein